MPIKKREKKVPVRDPSKFSQFNLIVSLTNICISSTKNILEDINENDFIITVKENRTSINKNSLDKPVETDKKDVAEMDKFTFMKQLEQDAEERAKNKRERERIAQNFRT